MINPNEAFSRILIDEELKYSGWDLQDPHQVRFEYHNHSGRADYLLMDKNGGVLCVLAAKKANLDPYDAKEQAALAGRIDTLYQSMLSRAFAGEL